MKNHQKVRILHLFGSMNCGGAETMLMNIYRNIDMSDIHFDFLVHSKGKGYYDAEITARGGNIYYIPSQGQVGMWRYLLILKKFLKENGPFDIVHSHLDWQGGIIALAARLGGIKKVIVHSHTSSWMKSENMKYKLLLGLQKICIFFCATDFWACSQNAADFLFYKKIIKKRYIQNITNAIDIDAYMMITECDRMNVRKQIGATAKTLVIGHVGSITSVKNQNFLIDIANILKSKNVDFKMVFAGKGSNHYEIEIKEKINKLELREKIVFLGLRDDIAKVMSAFDVFMLPSIYEGLAMVAIEAQASGLPCIVSTGVPGQVDMGLGLVTQLSTKNTEQWISLIMELGNNRQYHDKQKIYDCLSKNGYNIKFSTNHIKDLYLHQSMSGVQSH